MKRRSFIGFLLALPFFRWAKKPELNENWEEALQYKKLPTFRGWEIEWVSKKEMRRRFPGSDHLWDPEALEKLKREPFRRVVL